VAAPRATVSNANHAVGYAGRLVTISAITPDGTTAVCVDRQGYEVRVSMLIQPAKGILPQPGEQWIVTQDVTNDWTFAAIATSDSTVFTNSGVAGEGVLPPDILPPSSPPDTYPPGTIQGDAIEPGSLTGAQIAAQTITNLNLATAAASTNVILDPQFTSAAMNTVRQQDPATTCTWTFATPSVSVAGGLAACTLALMPSTLVPLYVNPGEQYYLAVSVTLPGGAPPGISAGIQLVLNDGSFLGPVLPVSGITQTVAQLITIPPGESSAYVRIVVTGLPSGVIATFTQPVCYITQGPNQMQANSISANALQANSVSTSALQANSVTAAQIAAGSISTGAIQAGAVTAAQIAANTITAAQIAAGTITAAQIAAGTITAAQIAAGTITAAQIQANTITAAQLAAGIVYAGIVDATTIQGATLIAGNLPNPQVRITSSAGQGIVDFQINQASVIDGYLQGVYGSGFAQMLLQGPRKNVAGHDDWVGLEMNSSDGTGSANTSLIYNSAGGAGSYLMLRADWNGVSLYNVGYLSALKPGTGGSAANPPQQEGWNWLTLTSAYVNQSGWIKVQYRLLAEGIVWIVGTINNNGGGALVAGTIGTLPAGWRPTATCGVPIATFGSSGTGNWYATINTNGNISIPLIGGATAMIFNGAFPLGIS
jgi:hypothetical protein